MYNKNYVIERERKGKNKIEQRLKDNYEWVEIYIYIYTYI